MVLNEVGVALHDRWTRGQVLTAEEQTKLEAWYQDQDEIEAKRLSSLSSSGDLKDLQTQVEASLTQLTTVIQRVQQVTTENEALRQEISMLRQALATPKSA